MYAYVCLRVCSNYLWYWFAMLLLVGLGFVIKATYIPERFLSPGKADILGASHQLWHILINTGPPAFLPVLPLSLLA